jgi:hypothetical protein
MRRCGRPGSSADEALEAAGRRSSGTTAVHDQEPLAGAAESLLCCAKSNRDSLWSRICLVARLADDVVKDAPTYAPRSEGLALPGHCLGAIGTARTPVCRQFVVSLTTTEWS